MLKIENIIICIVVLSNTLTTSMEFDKEFEANLKTSNDLHRKW